MQINEIILQTHLINDLKNFYGSVLNLEISSDNDDSFSVNAGASFIRFEKFAGNAKPFYHFAFNIPENKLSSAKKWMQSKAELIKSPEDGEDEFHFQSWNAHSIFFYDPAGNILEFIARHNLMNGTADDFTEKNILNVSEIGVPVKSLNKISDIMNQTYGIPLFSGDNETFSAMGNDNGLFIIVKNGRKWFPDCPEAQIFPLSVKVNCGMMNGNYSDESDLKIAFLKE
jgi:catechol-2,3-dioxygenase